eukprot:410802-Amphidinium_carterae.2
MQHEIQPLCRQCYPADKQASLQVSRPQHFRAPSTEQSFQIVSRQECEASESRPALIATGIVRSLVIDWVRSPRRQGCHHPGGVVK